MLRERATELAPASDAETVVAGHVVVEHDDTALGTEPADVSRRLDRMITRLKVAVAAPRAAEV